MTVKIFALILLLTPAILARPQLITFQDGKIGVNWGGYHAEAGLGGLLTGNAAHGGLSASAGTPHGQVAGAGLGGNLNDGFSNGGLFAGASSGFGQGASAALGGNTGSSGVAGAYGAESHSGDLSTKVLGVGQASGGQSESVHQVTAVEAVNPAENSIAGSGHISSYGGSTNLGTRFATEEVSQPEIVTHTKTTYKKKVTTHAAPQPQVFYYEKNVNLNSQPAQHHIATRFESTHQQSPQPNAFDFGIYGGTFGGGAAAYGGAPQSIVYQKTVIPAQTTSYVAPQAAYGGASAGASAGGYAGAGGLSGVSNRGSFFDSIFNIPIATLTAVNQLLNGGLNGGGAVHVQKSVYG